jgi:hypothetical protein
MDLLLAKIQKLPEELERKIWLYVHEINLHKVNQEFLKLTYKMDCRDFVSEYDYYNTYREYVDNNIYLFYSSAEWRKLENKTKTIRKYNFPNGSSISTTRLLVVNIRDFRKNNLRVLPRSCWMKAILQCTDDDDDNKYLTRYNKYNSIQSTIGKHINFNVVNYYNL